MPSAPQPLPDPEYLRIRGARTHNLQNIDLDLPRDRLVVITGLSGSGKSSLAFDTIYAEGQRQYIESLSVHSRQFFDQLQRPDVDSIDGLQPTIAIDQRRGSHNPRSTVATITEIHDHLRLLMARVGQAHCYQCGLPIRQQSPEQILEDVLRLPERSKAMLMAPLVRGRKGAHADVLETIRKAGFVRARVDGQLYDLQDVPELSSHKKHSVEAVVDRITVREGARPRIAESINLALRHGDGVMMISWQPPADAGAESPRSDIWHDRLYSTYLACPECGLSYEEVEPRTFSFNSPYGACPDCEGLGYREAFDPELVIPDASKSLGEGAVAPWRQATAAEGRRHRQQLAPFLAAAHARWNTPLDKLTPRHRDQLWAGDGGEFIGLLNLLEQQYATAVDAADREKLELFRGQVRCGVCGGARLRPEARAVKLGDKAIHQITAETVSGARDFFLRLELNETEELIGRPVVEQILHRLDFLGRVGLDYLTLDRPADTLSGGEAQRVRLASGIGSGLVGVCYVLDEPSVGLHPRDNDRLIDALRRLQQDGNTVIVVEHDEAVMRCADHLVDLGPGPGRLGGRVVAQGAPESFLTAQGSLTADYLRGTSRIETPPVRRPTSRTRAIVIEGVSTNNLKDVSASFPLGGMVCVTGVSGSGKSSLMSETFAPAVARRLGAVARKPGAHTSLRGVRQIDKFVEIDQSPIGRSPRSNPATYTGLFDELRKVYAGTKEAKLRGFSAGRFSFNVKGGRCEACQGQGLQRMEMNFLPDLYVTCAECGGGRFNRQTLEVRYRGRSIAETLELSVRSAREEFHNFPVMARMLESLEEVGLGYLSIGQASTTLSGGEAQRIKLAAELARVDGGSTLYLLDEPTGGLHFDDVRRLLAVLHRLVDRGNTVIVVEHHLDVIKTADWIIDLGPEGGAAGGEITAVGTPEEIAALADNHTGRYLREALAAGT